MAADNETAPSGSGHCTTNTSSGDGSTTTSTSSSSSSNIVLPPSSVSKQDVSNSLVYYKRGDKKNTARSVLKDVSKYNDYRALNEIICDLLDPRKDFSSPEIISWINHLIAGGRTPEEFSTIVKSYDQATSCGLVWTANFVAYRCRTCGISPCMSLCAECFQKGNHEGHDYNMFRSQAGGACDCGDGSVMKTSGFCSVHQPASASDDHGSLEPPQELLLITTLILPKLLHRLLVTLRGNQMMAVHSSDNFVVKVLTFLTEMGDSMRKIVSSILIDESIYSSLATADYNPVSPVMMSDDLSISDLLFERIQSYKRAKKELSTFTPSAETCFHQSCSICPAGDLKRIKSFELDLQHETFVDELLFWTIIYEFPQKLVCFLLNLLPNYEYKTRFARSFVNHYSRISMMLARFRRGDESPPSARGSSSSAATAHDQLSNCVVHVSVQLFSNEPLAEKLCREDHLLHVMITSLRTTIEGSSSSSSSDHLQGILIKSTMSSSPSSQSQSCNHHFVVRCDHYIMRKHTYWPLVSDLNNILTHEPVSIIFLNDDSLIQSWMDFMVNFQGMNLNQRELVEHVEYENESYYAAFSAELEICSTPIWTLISHLSNGSTSHLTAKMIRTTLKVLDKWFDSINFTSFDVPSPVQATFHVPLHRYLSIFLHHGVQKQGLMIDSFLPSSDCKLKQMVSHPLQTIISFYEILCGLWTRNGLQMKGQAMTYIQCHFCNSMIDPDLFLIQTIACKLDDPDWFIQMVFERFHVLNWMSFSSNNTFNKKSDTFLEPDQVMPMIEATLTFLATLLTTRTNLGMAEADVMRKEMVTLLSMSDRTHSQLMDLLPEKCGTSNSSNNNCHEETNFESILASIAGYKEPTFETGSGNLSQGMFHPKSEVWIHEFDPIHVLLRAVHRRDYQSSMDRFANFVARSNSNSSSSNQHLWPPFRLPAAMNHDNRFNDPTQHLLQSKVLHGILFSILFKAVHGSDPSSGTVEGVNNNTYTITDQVLSLTIYLLELCFHSLKGEDKKTDHDDVIVVHEPEGSVLSPFCVLDLKYGEWFTSGSILSNFNTIIQSISCPVPTSGPLTIHRVPSDTFGPSVEEMEVDLQSNDEDDDDDGNNGDGINDDEDQFMSADEDFEDDDSIHQMMMAAIESAPPTASLPSITVPLALLPAPQSSTSSTGSQLSPSALALVPSQREIALMNSQHHHYHHQAVSASPPATTALAIMAPSTTTGSGHLGPPALPGPSTSPIVAASSSSWTEMRRRRAAAAGRAITAAPNVNPSSGSHLRVPNPVQMARSAPSASSSFVPDDLKALPASSSTTCLTHSSTFVNESILSLLLKLHSKLSRRDDSYRYNSTTSGSRIGDGAHFVGNLIDTFVSMSPVHGLAAVNEWRQRIWPSSHDHQQRSCSSLGMSTEDGGIKSCSELELKKKRAKERQQRLMAEFANKQKAFLKSYNQQQQQSSCDDDPQPSTSTSSTTSRSADEQKLFECVICNQSSASSAEKLIGMIVLLQSTSVLGHSLPVQDIKNGSYKEANQVLNEASKANSLTCNPEEERSMRLMHESCSTGKLMRSKYETFEKCFPSSSSSTGSGGLQWLNAVSIGYEGGVHVASCGHYLHLDCHKSYLTSLRTASGAGMMNPSMRQGLEAGEFSCPLCRQLANSVLPILPPSTSSSSLPVSRHPPDIKCREHLEVICTEIQDLLFSDSSTTSSGSSEQQMMVMKLMGGFMEDLTRATSPQFRSLPTSGNPTPTSLNLFLCSIIRTNVEIDVINRLVTRNVLSSTGTGSCPNSNKKKDCFKALFNVMVLNARVFINRSLYALYWSSLTGSSLTSGDDESMMSMMTSGSEDEVPFLLKDPSALLIQFLFCLPLNLERCYFVQVTSVLFNLVIVQSLLSVSCLIPEEERIKYRKLYLQSTTSSDGQQPEVATLERILGLIIHQLSGSLEGGGNQNNFYSNLVVDEKLVPSGGWSDLEEVASAAMVMCLPFLRAAAILQGHLFDDDSLNDMNDDDVNTWNEFERIKSFLKIPSFTTFKDTSMDPSDPASIKMCNQRLVVSSLWWPGTGSRDKVIKLWCQDLSCFSSASNILFMVQNLVSANRMRPVMSTRPALLRLPPTYDSLFLFYHQSKCAKCRKVPKEPCLCLICGSLICMRDPCCRVSALGISGGSAANSGPSALEAVAHATSCGTSTGIFLAINSSTIIVIRGKRACVWGSLYLDGHGEEDRDLKRGKPLYLSQSRFGVLEHQWLSHSFDHTNKRWVWHKDTL